MEEAVLPQLLYDILLKENDWKEDYVNNSRILKYDSPMKSSFGSYWEVWPYNEESFEDRFVLNIQTASKLGGSYLLITYDANLPVIIETIIKFSGTDDIEAFIGYLINIPTINVFTLKNFTESKGGTTKETHRKIIEETISTLFNPVFEPIDWISFYLATLIDSSIVIRKENFDQVVSRLIAHFSNNEYIRESLEMSQNVEELFNCLEAFPEFNKQGDMVNLEQGGDIWLLEELATIKDLIEENSFIVLQDDGYVWWKVVYTPQVVHYFRELQA